MITQARYARIKEINRIEHLRAPIAGVFRAMTTSKTIDDWGGGPARVQPRQNGRYSLWDGDMFGIIKEIDFPRRLVYTLRESFWEESLLDSLVVWEFEESRFGTRLTLHHSGFPSVKIRDAHNDGWGEYYLGPLKAYVEKVSKLALARS